VNALRRLSAAGSTVGGTPWRSTHAVKTAVLIAVGIMLWAIGWYQVAGRTTMKAQAGPMNLAIVGVVVAGVGQALWILDGRRRVGLRRRVLIGSALRRPRPTSTAQDTAAGPLYSAEGLHLYHRKDCPMGDGREWSPMTRGSQEATGRTPCGVCKP
jgi:hypothetical protein